VELWDFIFGSEKGGYVRIALADKKSGKWNQRFVKWPDDKEQLDDLGTAGNRGDLYFTPALYRTPGDGRKSNILGGMVGWADIDHDEPLEDEPPLVVFTGSTQHRHVYVPLESFTDRDNLEAFNLYLNHKYNGDPSGWDACQLLRVPGTFNHKHSPPTPVTVGRFEPNSRRISELPTTPLQLPSLNGFKPLSFETVLLQHELPDPLRNALSKAPVEVFDRSAALWHVAMLASEAGLQPEEVFPLLEYADKKWGKFVGRDDKELRYKEICQRAALSAVTADFPELDLDSGENPKALGRARARPKRKPLGWKSISLHSEPIHWIVQDVIRENGLTFFYSKTESGKSTLAINICALIASGSSNWLGYNISQDTSQRILYASSEMQQDEVAEFKARMDGAFFDDLQEKLEERLHFVPSRGAYLNTKEGQKEYEEWIKEGGYSGLVIDTLGASISTSLTDEKEVRKVVDWVDKMRDELGIWVLILHHNRKDPNTKGRKQIYEDDTDNLYGAGLLAHRANVIIRFTKRADNQVVLTAEKSRLGAKEKGLVLQHGPNHFFIRTDQKVPVGSAKRDVNTADFPETELDGNQDNESGDGF